MALPPPAQNQTALITGASSGIGTSLAHQFARRGHVVTLVARRAARLEELAGELNTRYGVRADAIPCDLTDDSARLDLVSTIRASGNDVAVLVNNAGFATGGRYAESEPQQEVQQVRLLIEAVVSLSSAFLPGMVGRGTGAILNVASTAGMQPLPYSAGYSAAKAHTLTFSEALHHEVAHRGITVTALCPGPVKTEFWDVADGQPIKQAMPPMMWVDVDRVAAAAIRGLDRGTRVVVPGLAVRAATYGGQLTPKRIKLPLLARAMRPKTARG